MVPYNNIPRYETIQGTVRGNAPENVVKRAAEIAKALDIIGADLSELNFHRKRNPTLYSKAKLHEKPTGPTRITAAPSFPCAWTFTRAYHDKHEGFQRSPLLVVKLYGSSSQTFTAGDSTHSFARPVWTPPQITASPFFAWMPLYPSGSVTYPSTPAWMRGEKPVENAHYKGDVRCEQSTTLTDAPYLRPYLTFWRLYTASYPRLHRLYHNSPRHKSRQGALAYIHRTKTHKIPYTYNNSYTGNTHIALTLIYTYTLLYAYSPIPTIPHIRDTLAFSQ